MIGWGVENATDWGWLRFLSFFIVSSLQLFFYLVLDLEVKGGVTSASWTHLSTRKLWNRAFVPWARPAWGTVGIRFGGVVPACRDLASCRD